MPINTKDDGGTLRGAPPFLRSSRSAGRWQGSVHSAGASVGESAGDGVSAGMDGKRVPSHYAVRQIFQTLARANPHPSTELVYVNCFQLLVAVVLSAQATDVSVNKATAVLFQKVSSPKQMLELSLLGLQEHIRSIGLFRTKASNIMQLSQRLETEYAGQVPANRESLESLPGVGRKTANVILNTAFHQPVIAVDTHIFRVSNRIGLASGETVLAVENGLYKTVPKKYLLNAHHWLILHGRYVCRALNPLCGQCSIRKWCSYGKAQSKS